jgi:hypothetical protein
MGKDAERKAIFDYGDDQAEEDPRSLSMHASVPTWCDDACCCEPEPRWQQVEEQRHAEA